MDTTEDEKDLHSFSSEDNFKKVIRSTRMKLVSSTKAESGFVRRSSRAYKGRKSELSELSDEEIEVQINKLPVKTLRKYKRFYDLSANVNMSKPKLVKLVENHFKHIDVSSENEIITYFIHFIKTYKE
ncbi:hypothetical protein PVAND_003610 [Polypedilum vanderplanki]|uniref:Histone deacetylase complex subunit SAP30 Sin3 binding domain-containing protein n=1 Tax=Polypedilum vanderplanki TaxID=319348 RepID=A0A9J6BUK1_POLVA|nr:hypothetical protein PVAND_003610 [Polypedilum vanderplanki]